MSWLAQQQPMMQPPQMPPTTRLPQAPQATVSATPIYNSLGYLRPGMPTSMNISGGLLTIDKYNAEEESSLMPEDEWLKYYPNNVTINVKVPNGGGESEWNFKGQIIQMSMDPRTTIEQLKEAICAYLGNMPAKKIRLRSFNHSALKEKNSLAHYNVIDSTLFELSVKERGGRKK